MSLHEYDDQGWLQRAFDADGYEAQYAYDDDGRFTWDKARDGLAYIFHYDKQGRGIESYGTYSDRGQRDPSVWQFPDRSHDGGPCKGVHHCRFDYGPGVPFVTGSTQTRNFFPNAHGTLDSFDEGGSVTQATYFPNGHLETLTDPEGGLSKYERDPRGRVTRFTEPLGRETQVERDAMGQPIRVTEPAGGVTELYREALGHVARYSYDGERHLTQVVSPEGHITKMEWGGATTSSYAAPTPMATRCASPTTSRASLPTS